MSRYKHTRDGKREHRVVWEKAHGPIPKGYVIHHKNGNGRDNRLENLQMMTHGEHLSLHAKLRREGRDPVDPNDPEVIKYRERIRKSGIKYRVLHKAEKAEYDKRYREEHEGMNASRCRHYRELHREELIKKQRDRYYKNHEVALAKMAEYRESHRELIRVKDRLNRAKRLGKPESVLIPLREAVRQVEEFYKEKNK